VARHSSRPWGRPARRFAPLILAILLVACSSSTPTPATSVTTPASTATTATISAASSAPAVATSTQPATMSAAVPTTAPTRASGTPTIPITSSRATPSTATARGPLTIFAASSLTDAFTELQTGFAKVAPDVAITFNFEASSNLKAQLEQGAKADLYAPADIPQMDGARGKGVIAGEQKIFANNKLALIVPANNPKGIAAPQDLAKPGTKLILAASYVPIGSYARFLLARMAGDPAYGPDFYKQALGNIVSEEANTRAVVNRIVLGEGDAGIVYASDVTPAVRDRVRVIPIPETLQVTAQYPIAVVTGAANTPAAQAFIAYLLSPEGQATLVRNGFIPVGPTAVQTGERNGRAGGR
jgi:molybdate transport system substrate-binding protein